MTGPAAEDGDLLPAAKEPGRTTAAALRGGTLLMSGQVATTALGFVRNLLLAAMLPLADFGVAATFAIAMSLLSTLGDLSVEKLLVQAPDGDDAAVQAAAQRIQFLRGLAAAAVLLAGGGLFAAAFGAPETAWAFRVLAIVPVVRGLAHLDVHRYHRTMRYGPGSVSVLAGQVFSTAAIWPLVAALGDYRAALVAILMQEAAAAVATHVLAERPYSWNSDRVVARRILRFGWPLVVNAALLFGVFQGDRVVVGTTYGLEALGSYSLVFMIAMTPGSIVAVAGGSVGLPLLARHQSDPPRFRAAVATLAQVLALSVAAVSVPLVLCTGPVLTAAFGERYATGADVAPWLAAMHGVRVLRLAPGLAALARGDTVTPMLSNVVRIAAVPAMAAAAAAGAPIAAIAAIGLGGELVTLAFTIGRIARLHGIRWLTTAGPCGASSAAFGAALAITTLWPAARDPWVAAAVAAAIVAGAVVAFLRFHPELRARTVEVRTYVSRVLGRGEREAGSDGAGSS